ncbi:uncharacterized protein LOC109826705 [Asparagus officinalis]|uniref:uncharacterized protein LOC109826705 n=1 Tax=Asparagus officinalis TaxID=4686 RepID=UPI00098E2C3E|nr:uncharacterized protein LOC109826705 [Asparagus officinalis]
MSSRRRSRGSSQSTSKATKKNKAELRLPSNIGVFRDLVNNRLRPLLHNNHYEALRQTPFFHFINLPAIPNEQVSVDCLLHAFNPEHSSFRIGGKDIVFSFVHVHEITGLPKTGNKVVMDGRAPNTIYTEHVYGKKTQTEKEEEKKAGKRKKRKVDKKDENKDKKKVWATRKRMADLIVELAVSNHIACVKLLVAFIIGFVLCPQPSNSCPLR